MVYARDTMAKYDSLRKLERNQMLKDYALAHPELSLKELSKPFGITESRVWRILNGNNKKKGVVNGS